MRLVNLMPLALLGMGMGLLSGALTAQQTQEIEIAEWKVPCAVGRE